MKKTLKSYLLLLILLTISTLHAQSPTFTLETLENSQEIETAVDDSISSPNSQEEITRSYSDSRTTSLENEFVKIIVNTQKEDMGRFAIETTQGDPQNPNDNNQSLIYGKPVPWASYTTVLVDGRPIVFGEASKKLIRRVGEKIQFGTILTQAQDTENITTQGQAGPIEIIQKLRLYTNPSTQVRDSALIEYTLINHSKDPHNVGLRIMMDTKLGANDGAPFRIGKDAITAEKEYIGKNILEYWQAFDSLITPNVIAQGSLIDKDHGVFPPDRMVLSNWGTLVDNPWNFQYEENRPFIRTGEIEQDTALGLYWNPISLQPGESRTIRTIYGLGGLTLSPGAIKLGLTAPSNVPLTSPHEFMILGYILNPGGYDIQNTEVTFDLPEGLRITKGNLSTKIPMIKAGETAQVPIKVILTNEASFGTHFIEMNVNSSTLGKNSVKRKINFNAAVNIEASLYVPVKKILGFNAYTDAILTLKNPSSFSISQIETEIDTKSLDLPNFETAKKKIALLKPFETLKINWKIKMPNNPKQRETLSVSIKAKGTLKKTITKTINIADPLMIKTLTSDKKTVSLDDVFYVEFNIENSQPFKETFYNITFNPEALELIRTSTSSDIEQLDQKIAERDGEVSIRRIKNTKKQPLLKIVKLHFKPLKAGKTEITLNENYAIQHVEVVEIKGEK